MNRTQFAEVFEQYQKDARRVVLAKFGGDAALAADAVQDAAAYVLEHLGRFKKLTRSYFVQLAVNRARNSRRGETRQQMRVTSIGGPHELVRAETAVEQRRRGRVLPYPGADKQAEIGAVEQGYEMPGRQPIPD